MEEDRIVLTWFAHTSQRRLRRSNYRQRLIGQGFYPTDDQGCRGIYHFGKDYIGYIIFTHGWGNQRISEVYKCTLLHHGNSSLRPLLFSIEIKFNNPHSFVSRFSTLVYLKRSKWRRVLHQLYSSPLPLLAQWHNPLVPKSERPNNSESLLFTGTYQLPRPN